MCPADHFRVKTCLSVSNNTGSFHRVHNIRRVKMNFQQFSHIQGGPEKNETNLQSMFTNAIENEIFQKFYGNNYDVLGLFAVF
jgi:hypothetical protein